MKMHSFWVVHSKGCQILRGELCNRNLYLPPDLLGYFFWRFSHPKSCVGVFFFNSRSWSPSKEKLLVYLKSSISGEFLMEQKTWMGFCWGGNGKVKVLHESFGNSYPVSSWLVNVDFMELFFWNISVDALELVLPIIFKICLKMSAEKGKKLT